MALLLLDLKDYQQLPCIMCIIAMSNNALDPSKQTRHLEKITIFEE